MFDFDAGKLMIIATVALIVIGPKDLPRVLRQFGQMVTRIKRMAGEFQNQFMDAMKEADIQDLRSEVAKLKDTAKLDIDFNPAKDIKAQLDDAMGTHVPTPNYGSTSETIRPQLPAASELGPDLPVAATPVGPVAATGVGPVAVEAADVPALVAPPPIDGSERSPSDEPRRKVVVRRRVVSRYDPATVRAPAMQRSRNILPARRETPES